MRKIKYKDLKVGMVCEDWDNAGKVISRVEVVHRPHMVFDMVRVDFEDGTSISMTENYKMNIQ